MDPILIALLIFSVTIVIVIAMLALVAFVAIVFKESDAFQKVLDGMVGLSNQAITIFGNALSTGTKIASGAKKEQPITPVADSQ